jgi:hypothetical protein
MLRAIGRLPADRLDFPNVAECAGEDDQVAVSVELPREESRGRLRDLVGSPHFLDPTLEIGQPLALVGRESRTSTGISFALANPPSQRLAFSSHLSDIERIAFPLHWIFVLVGRGRALRPLRDLRRILVIRHGSILPTSRACTNPGRFTRAYHRLADSSPDPSIFRSETRTTKDTL